MNYSPRVNVYWDLKIVCLAKLSNIFFYFQQSSDGSRPAKTATNPGISFLYMAKILVAFVLLFVLGASFTLALENLPRLILFINSFM